MVPVVYYDFIRVSDANRTKNFDAMDHMGGARDAQMFRQDPEPRGCRSRRWQCRDSGGCQVCTCINVVGFVEAVS